jgi:hypothetical protein
MSPFTSTNTRPTQASRTTLVQELSAAQLWYDDLTLEIMKLLAKRYFDGIALAGKLYEAWLYDVNKSTGFAWGNPNDVAITKALGWPGAGRDPGHLSLVHVRGGQDRRPGQVE